MGNHLSPHKSTTLNNLHDNKDDILSIRANIQEKRSSSLTKRISSSTNDPLIIDVRPVHGLSDLKITRDNFLNEEPLGIPTVFRWYGNGEKIYISGSFNNWNEKIRLKKSDTLYYTIINCQSGHHSYKFLVDGEWRHDPTQPTEMNSYGTLNNWLEVVEDDFNIDMALNHDEKFSIKSSSDYEYIEDPNAVYGQQFPLQPKSLVEMKMSNVFPNHLPPYLNETVLNIEDSVHNDPNLLRTPVYVQINHLYASSITGGIAALSVTIRYRTKFITTVFYKPIS